MLIVIDILIDGFAQAAYPLVNRRLPAQGISTGQDAEKMNTAAGGGRGKGPWIRQLVPAA